MTSAHGLEAFARQAIVYTTLEPRNVKRRYVDALAAYMRSLAPVPPPTPRDPALFARGEALFRDACARCHDGRNGASTGYHDLAEISGPPVYQRFLVDAPRANRQTRALLAGLAPTRPLALDHKRGGVKARRLVGLWARARLGTNGMVPGLDGLLCLDGVRRPDGDPAGPLSGAMHRELCEAHDEPARRAHKEYLAHFPVESEAPAPAPAVKPGGARR